MEKITSTDHDYEQQKEQKGGRGGGGVKIQANHKHDPQNAWLPVKQEYDRTGL